MQRPPMPKTLSAQVSSRWGNAAVWLPCAIHGYPIGGPMKPFDIAYFKEVTSTNDNVKQALRAHANEGYVCRARKQTVGYGRMGRLWTSPEGGLYQSLLIRPGGPVESLPTLGLVMALAIRAALLRLAALPPESILVKWPNDLMVGDSKIAGTSMEVTSNGVCIGMGVNVFRPKETIELLSDSQFSPAYFADLAIGFTGLGEIAFGNGYTFANQQDAIDAVGNATLSAFGQCYPVWQANGFEPFLKEYESANYLQGKYVRMQLISGEIITEGTVIGVDEKTACLKVDDGIRVNLVNSGEAHVLS